MQKNIASQKWRVFAFDRTTNAPLTNDATNITAKISKDFGTANATNSLHPAEVEDGYYEFDLTQAETNADDLLILPESATANIIVVGCPARIATTPASWSDGVIQTGDAYDRIGTNGAGLTSLAPASTALSTATWTGTLATNLATTNSTVATNLDSAVSTRSSHSAADVWAVVTRTLSAFGFTVTTANAADVTAILADTNELQTNQGNWLTATGFSTHSAADVYTAFGTGSNLTALVTATGFSTHSAADVIALLSSGTEVFGHSYLESIKRIEVTSGSVLSGAGTGTEVQTSSDASKTVTWTVDGSGNIGGMVWT